MPRPAPYRDAPRLRRQDALVEAAWLYFHETLTQTQIADRLGVSRATVVNYLQEARALGLVRIVLSDEPFTRHRLAQDLAARFGLAAAYVVPEAASGEETLARVAAGAGQWLPSLLAQGDRLGVAWGRTVFEVAQRMDRVSRPGLRVVQLVGSVPSPFGFTAEVCSAKLAEKLGAECVNLFAPAVLSSAPLARALRAEPVIARQIAMIASCNKAIFAAGTCDADSHIVGSGVATPDDLAAYRRRGARAVLCGRFIDGAGAPLEGPLDARMIGVEPESLRGLDMGLLVSTGADRVAPMRAVLAGGYVTHLVTDAATARALNADPPP